MFKFKLQGHILALGNASEQGTSDRPAPNHPQRAARNPFKRGEVEEQEKAMKGRGSSGDERERGSCCIHITTDKCGRKMSDSSKRVRCGKGERTDKEEGSEGR